jgi:hypothetical protein
LLLFFARRSHGVQNGVQVRAPDGEEYDLWLDPTGAQFGEKQMLSWHARNMTPGQRYQANTERPPPTFAEHQEMLQRQLDSL